MSEIRFPLVIEDLPQLRRMVRSIAREVATEVHSVVAPQGGKNLFMTKQECYREAGSRLLVDRAILSGSLPVRTKEGRRGILRQEFAAWVSSHAESFARRTKRSVL